MNKIIKYNGKLNVIGEKIHNLRTEKGWSLASLSDNLMFIGFDIPKSSINNIEKGKRVVKEYELYAFCKVFGVSMEDLMEDFIKQF